MSVSPIKQTPEHLQASPFLTRTAALLGSSTLQVLHSLHLLIVGIGAVGGACAEALARSGVGHLTLIDGDTFDASNLNRQPFSSYSAIGHSKVEITLRQLQDLAPTCQADGQTLFLTPERIPTLLDTIHVDGVIDAIDDLPAKVALLAEAHQRNIPVWSAMGAARKLDPLAFRITDIAKTQICPLARNVRHALRQKGITKGIRCVWSSEPAQPLREGTLGSYMPVTATAGLLLAADVLQTYHNRAQQSSET